MSYCITIISYTRIKDCIQITHLFVNVSMYMRSEVKTQEALGGTAWT